MFPLPQAVPAGSAGALTLSDVRLPDGATRLALTDPFGAVVLIPEGTHAFLAALCQAAAHGIPGLDTYLLPEDTVCECAPKTRSVRIRQPGGEILVAWQDLMPLAQALDARAFLP
jgi:hypothetical protein